VRLFEFNSKNARIISLVSQLQRKAEGKESAKIRMGSFKKMLKNMGISMSNQGLESLVGTDPAFGKLVTSVDDQYLTLNMTGEEPDMDMGMDDDMGDLDMELGDEEPVDDMGMDMGMDDDVGATTDDFEDPMMQGGNAAGASQNAVPNMAKRALSRRT